MVIQEMTKSDCLSALAHARLGRLACAHENQPYIVPIYFAYEEPYLYGFATPGQKVEWMRSNPLVCVELDEVEARDQWTSIILFGQYEELPGTPEGDPAQPHVREPSRRTARPTSISFAEQERLHAHDLLQEHAVWWEPGSVPCTHSNPGQLITPVFYRIRIDRITGRRATPGPSGPHRSSARPAARGSQSWLRGVFHALARPFAGRGGVKGPE
jgi:nitroimidazol reductase NimA-like FMN-containing flavoprotein (pyridoxamine 5'-phosphate oxidase superfamily)